MPKDARQVDVTPETLQQRLGAMRSGPNGHAGPVDDHGYIMSVDAFNLEGHDRSFARRITKYPQRIDLAEFFVRVGAQIRLMCSDGIPADAFDIVQRGPQPDRLDDGRRAGPRSDAAGRCS